MPRLAKNCEFEGCAFHKQSPFFWKLNMRPLFLRFAPLFGIFLFGQALAQDGPITGKEIEETWVGKELVGITASGAKVNTKLEANGKASVSVGNTKDIGTWRVAQNGYCTTWQTIRPGQERCFAVTRSGNTFKVMNPDGSLSGTFTDVK
jgi:hypothetical protein